jgi:hypothetical protein
MLGATARVALARHAAEGFSKPGWLFVGFSNRRDKTDEG